MPAATKADMVEAAKSGNLEQLQEHRRDWDATHPDAPACFGTDACVRALWTAASRAAVKGRMRVLQWLVEEKGVPVHCLSPEEEALIEADYHSDNGDRRWHTPLASAVFGNQEEAALYLLRAGLERGDIDTEHDTGCSGETFAFFATVQGVSPRLLTALLEEGGFDPGSGPDPGDGRTPLSLAANTGNIPLVDALLAYARRHGSIRLALQACLDRSVRRAGCWTSSSWSRI